MTERRHMADGQPTTARQLTGDDIIAEILRNAEQGVFKIRYTALLPSIYHVYLHPSDYDTIRPVITALAAEARAALIERLDELEPRLEALWHRPDARASTPASTSNTRFSIPTGRSSSIRTPKTGSDAGDIEIYSELASAERPEFGEGAMTRHVTKRLEFRRDVIHRGYPHLR